MIALSDVLTITVLFIIQFRSRNIQVVAGWRNRRGRTGHCTRNGTGLRGQSRHSLLVFLDHPLQFSDPMLQSQCLTRQLPGLRARLAQRLGKSLVHLVVR